MSWCVVELGLMGLLVKHTQMEAYGELSAGYQAMRMANQGSGGGGAGGGGGAR